MLRTYSTLDEDQKNAIEVDWAKYQVINPNSAGLIDEKVNEAKLTKTLSAKGKAYVEEYGIDRLKAHLSALIMVNNEDSLNRGRSYFNDK